MNKPGVLHIRDSIIVGSPEKLIVGQINELNGVYDFYFCSYFRNSEVAKELTSLGIRVLNVPFTRWCPISAIVALRKLIRDYDIKLICCHDYKSNFLGIISGKTLGIPVVSVFHGRTSHDLKLRCYEAIDNFILRGFEKVIAVSEASKSKLIDLGIGAEKIEVVCNAVELQKQNKCISSKELRKELSISKEDETFAQPAEKCHLSYLYQEN